MEAPGDGGVQGEGMWKMRTGAIEVEKGANKSPRETRRNNTQLVTACAAVLAPKQAQRMGLMRPTAGGRGQGRPTCCKPRATSNITSYSMHDDLGSLCSGERLIQSSGKSIKDCNLQFEKTA